MQQLHSCDTNICACVHASVCVWGRVFSSRMISDCILKKYLCELCCWGVRYNTTVFDVLDEFGALKVENIVAAILKTPGLRQRLGKSRRLRVDLICLLSLRSRSVLIEWLIVGISFCVEISTGVICSFIRNYEKKKKKKRTAIECFYGKKRDGVSQWYQ